MICSSLNKLPLTEHKIVFQLGDTKNLGSCDIVIFDREEDMLTYFKEFICNYDPDVILGFNSIKFDMM